MPLFFFLSFQWRMLSDSPIPANGARIVDPTLIAVAQLAITVAEPDANRRAAADAVAEAAASGARLVVLPELCDSGYVFDAAGPAAEARGLAAPAADSATLQQWHELAARHRLVIVGGFCEQGADGRLYNSAALVDTSTGARAVYRKAAPLGLARSSSSPPATPAPPVGRHRASAGSPRSSATTSSSPSAPAPPPSTAPT